VATNTQSSTRRTRRGLDRAAVIRAAAAMLDEAPGSDMTLTSLALALGVRTPSLYNHIDGQEGLRRGLALLGVQELGEQLGRAAIGKAGADALYAVADAYRAFALRRPGLYLSTIRAPDADDVELLAASDDVLEVLRLALDPFGLTDDEQIHAIRGLRSIAHGFVSIELGGGFGLPIDLDTSYQRLVGAFVDGLAARQRSKSATSAGSISSMSEISAGTPSGKLSQPKRNRILRASPSDGCSSQ